MSCSIILYKVTVLIALLHRTAHTLVKKWLFLRTYSTAGSAVLSTHKKLNTCIGIVFHLKKKTSVF